MSKNGRGLVSSGDVPDDPEFSDILTEAMGSLVGWNLKEAQRFEAEFNRLKKVRGKTLNEAFKLALDALGGPAFLTLIGLRQPAKFIELMTRSQPKDVNVKSEHRLIFVTAPSKMATPIDIERVYEDNPPDSGQSKDADSGRTETGQMRLGTNPETGPISR